MKNIELGVGESQTFKYNPVDAKGVPISPLPAVTLGLVEDIHTHPKANTWDSVKFTGGDTLTFTGQRPGITFFTVSAKWTDAAGIAHSTTEIFGVKVETDEQHSAWEEVVDNTVALLQAAATDTKPATLPTLASAEPAAGSVGVNP